MQCTMFRSEFKFRGLSRAYECRVTSSAVWLCVRGRKRGRKKMDEITIASRPIARHPPYNHVTLAYGTQVLECLPGNQSKSHSCKPPATGKADLALLS